MKILPERGKSLFLPRIELRLFFFFPFMVSIWSLILVTCLHIFYLCSLFILVHIVTKLQMERKELYDAPNNSGPLEQELSLEDFGDCELKSKPYVGLQFDYLDDVETFYKEFAKKEGFGFCIRT